MAKKNVCSICGKEFEGSGNNAMPVNDGCCCDECSRDIVIPRRINDMSVENDGCKKGCESKAESNEVRAKKFVASIVRESIIADAECMYEYIMVDGDPKQAFGGPIAKKRVQEQAKRIDDICKKYLDVDSCRIAVTKYSEYLNDCADFALPIIRHAIGVDRLYDILISCAAEILIGQFEDNK